MKKFLTGLFIGLSFIGASAYAFSTYQVFQGGTGATSFTVGNCLKGNGTSPITDGTCGGGSGGGTFSTTTSTVANQLINYPNNNTDIVTVGGNSTSTAKFYFDPNLLFASLTGRLSFANATGTTFQVTGASYIPKLSNLTTNGFVTTSGGNGTLGVDTNTYLQTVTADSPLSGSGTSGSHLVLSTAGTWSGNAGTATALAANGTNCSAGSYPLGVDASGNSETCTVATTGTVTSVTASTPNSTLSLGGTNPVTTSGTISFDLNLAHANTWSALQSFANASSSLLSATYAQFGGTGTTTIDRAGQVGIASSTPGSLLSIGNTTGINFREATSTFNSTGGIDLRNGGCFAIAGTCISGSGGGGSGTVGSGTTGQFPFYNGAGTTLTATSTLFITQAGAIGIGTVTPTDVNASSDLTIAGAGATDVIASTTDNTTLSTAIIEAYAPGSRIFMGAHGTNQVSTQYGITVGGWGEIGAINSTFGTSNGLLIGTRTTNAPIQFGTNSLARLRIEAGGNVDVGTTTGYAKETIWGSGTGLGQTLEIANNASTTIGMVWDNGQTYFLGNMGIASTSPGSLLSLGTSNGINFSTATSSFNSTGGIRINSGCFAIGTTCIGSGTGTVTAVTGTYPIISSGGTTPAISTAFGTTTTIGVGTGQLLSVNESGVMVATSTIGNNQLQNSTISGVSLGGTLAALTATDSTLTFSGSYTGTTARTVGLNLTNPNTWTALQQFATASTTTFGCYGPCSFGATATTTITSSGQVGVGTTTPQFPLTSFSTTGGQLALTEGSGKSQIVFRNEGGVFAIASTTTAGATTTPSALELNTNAGSAGYYFGTSTPGATGISAVGTDYLWNLSGSSGLQVGILCLSASNEVINESVACVASSEKYKQNIKPLSAGLEEVLKLKPVSFKWKPDYLGNKITDPNQNGEQYSLIAEEVQKIDPNMVSVETQPVTFEGKTYPAGTVHGLADTNHWAALFTKAIQDLNAKVGSVKRGAEENWQDLLIGLLIIGFIYQQVQIRKLKHDTSS